MLEPSLISMPPEFWLLMWVPPSIPRTQFRFHSITPEDQGVWGKSGPPGVDTLSPLTGKKQSWDWLDRSSVSLAKTSKRLNCLQVPFPCSLLLSALMCAIKWEIICWLPLMIWSWPGFVKEVPRGSSAILTLFSSKTLKGDINNDLFIHKFKVSL